MSERKTIMLVDDNPVNLTVGKNMLKDRFKVSPVPSAEMMFDLLKNLTPDIILLDVEMPDMDGYEAIKRLKSKSEWADIPVIFLTVKIDEESEFKGLSLGAADYVHKPFVASLLIKRIENHLLISEQKRRLFNENQNLFENMIDRQSQIFDLQNAVISIIANLVEFRDDVTGNHIMRTQRYIEILIEQMLKDEIYLNEISEWDFDFLLPSVKLHDVGKIGINDAILNKPGKLTPDEFEIMKKHVDIGVDAIYKMEKIVKESTFLQYAHLFVASHHEKWDGTGYPAGVKGYDIPLEGRMLAVVDVYDALVSKRPYKLPLKTSEAKDIILDSSGTHFDPALISSFEKCADKFAEVVKKGVYR